MNPRATSLIASCPTAGSPSLTLSELSGSWNAATSRDHRCSRRPCSACRGPRRPTGPDSLASQPDVPLDAFLLALGAAALHAGWNILVARAEDVRAATTVAVVCP